MKTSINCGPELTSIKDKSGNYGFSKRLNVIAERYNHIVHTYPCPALTNDTIEVLRAIPKIATMRASMIEHLPFIVMNNSELAHFPPKQIHAAYREVKALNVVQRIICIERLEH